MSSRIEIEEFSGRIAQYPLTPSLFHEIITRRIAPRKRSRARDVDIRSKKIPNRNDRYDAERNRPSCGNATGFCASGRTMRMRPRIDPRKNVRPNLRYAHRASRRETDAAAWRCAAKKAPGLATGGLATRIAAGECPNRSERDAPAIDVTRIGGGVVVDA